MLKTSHTLSVALVFFLSALWGAASSAASGGDVLLGRYWLPEHDGQFEIYIKEDRYFGRVIAYHEPDQLDEQNADPKLRSRRFVGIDMLANFEFDPNKHQWTGGTIYDGANGKTYDCNLWFEEGEPNVLQGRGFIGFSFLGRTENFDRVTETP